MKHIFILIVACACHQASSPVADSGDSAALGDSADPCAAGCSHLAALGCLEGTDVNCVPACQKNMSAPITVLPLGCWLDAGDKTAAKACGLSCP